MKIIITESQYKLIAEREDINNVQEINEVYNAFVIKYQNKDFRQSINNYNTELSVVIDTKYGKLEIVLTEKKNTDSLGHYVWNKSGRVPKIIIFNCAFEYGSERTGNNLKIKKLNAQILKHEIVHFIDDKKGRKLPEKTVVGREAWANDTHEINAEFLSVVNQIRKKKDYVLPDTFEKFLKSYKGFSLHTASQFDHINDKRKKSLIGRLYQYYTYLKEKDNSVISESDNGYIMMPMDYIRRPNGSVGTQGYTTESIVNLVRHISDVYGLNLPEYESLKDLVLSIREMPEVKDYIMAYVKGDPIIVNRLPDETYHLKDGNHRANLLNLLHFDFVPAIIK